ncbi:hypothetical protein JIX56_29350 [Streptomyces sp. CA-210063]|uniref:hypothetical protein n=1 Tax=Streptomyces sp. CA-210063 TaxID=2801029 RepID=UPI00214ABA91|nr:hypothetical protein [Streptomyces sp. CA-210063]UUU33624.1 hypothetical protein JIX56_29350 [Streptomyces sp. CA-210063]
MAPTTPTFSPPPGDVHTMRAFYGAALGGRGPCSASVGSGVRGAAARHPGGVGHRHGALVAVRRRIPQLSYGQRQLSRTAM